MPDILDVTLDADGERDRQERAEGEEERSTAREKNACVQRAHRDFPSTRAEHVPDSADGSDECISDAIQFPAQVTDMDIQRPFVR